MADDTKCFNPVAVELDDGVDCAGYTPCWTGYTCEAGMCKNELTLGTSCSSDANCTAFPTTPNENDFMLQMLKQECNGTHCTVPNSIIVTIDRLHGDSCVSAGQCISGVCTSGACVGKAYGEACAMLGCGPELFCNSSNVCDNANGLGGVCGWTPQCKDGSVCNIGNTCEAPQSVDINGNCSNTLNCKPGLVCIGLQNDWSSMRCVPPYVQPCDVQEDCPIKEPKITPDRYKCQCWYETDGKASQRCHFEPMKELTSTCESCYRTKCGSSLALNPGDQYIFDYSCPRRECTQECKCLSSLSITDKDFPFQVFDHRFNRYDAACKDDLMTLFDTITGCTPPTPPPMNSSSSAASSGGQQPCSGGAVMSLCFSVVVALVAVFVF